MAYVAPFRALRYDVARVPLSQVVTQPYDKISPEMQERYYAASPCNLVRIILGKRQETDQSGDNVYTRAADFFAGWRSQGILRQDNEPSIYRYTQKFIPPGGGAEMERSGFIALGRIEDYSACVVHRHEQTLSKPKADRLDLLRATRAHFGQIFMIYSDPDREVEKAVVTATNPDGEVQDEYGVLHKIWRVSDPAVIDFVRRNMRDKKLIIADGHHRYETSLNYRNERRSVVESGTAVTRPSAPPLPLPPIEEAPPPYEFSMMTFVNMDSPGLLILPTHRVVYGLDSFSMEKFEAAAAGYFDVQKVNAAMDADHATSLLRDAGKNGTALLGISRDEVLLLERPKNLGSPLFGALSSRQQSLDIVQLHKCLLEGALGLSEESIRNQQNIRYVRDASEALAQVRAGDANIAFLMNPVRMEQMRDIAFAGEVLPQKSTDFYPKLLSGLTIYALE
jgi:uncharacterized protein (DUF1015 family)